MTQGDGDTERPSRPARWLVWSVYTLLWTAGLLFPTGVLDLEERESRITPREVITKTLHVAAYAVMAYLAGWVRAPLRYRWLLMFFLMAHAGLTELGQLAVQRDGKLTDVLLDQIGIAIGVALSWRWWTEWR